MSRFSVQSPFVSNTLSIVEDICNVALQRTCLRRSASPYFSRLTFEALSHIKSHMCAMILRRGCFFVNHAKTSISKEDLEL